VSASKLEKTERTVGKTSGSSPADDKFYIIALFDISEPKKYRALIRIFKSYSLRIQKSVFEAQLTRQQYKEFLTAVEHLMASERFYCPSDNVRVYRIAGNCDVTIFGHYENSILEDNIFI
jgi:CRISPR-associated endonuclease Cas2